MTFEVGVLCAYVGFLIVLSYARMPDVSRLYGQERNLGKSGDRTVTPPKARWQPIATASCYGVKPARPAPTAEWQPSALDQQFALMLETYNDQSQTSCIALFKVDLSEMANAQGVGAVLYRLSLGRA